MAAASEGVIYHGIPMNTREFLKNEICIAIERYDLDDGMRVLTQTHFEPDPFNATAYLYEEIEKYKNRPVKERPKFEMLYADKYGNKIL